MPWSNQGGGNWQGGGRSGGQGPWGQKPNGSGGGQGGGDGGGQGGGGNTPDLEDLIRRGQERFRSVTGGSGGFSPIFFLMALVVLAIGWLGTGIYRVGVDEVGVVTQFGAFNRIEQPGLKYHLPWPIEAVQTPKVTQQRSIDVGFSTLGSGERRDRREESLMLTGDENIVDIDFTVLWRISDASNYLFNVQNPAGTVKAIAESVMREVVAQNKIDEVLTSMRAQIQSQVRELMQATLDGYESGIVINEVQLQNVDPPGAVIEAFRDVQAAEQDQERQRNEAQAYANRVIPEARGDAEQIKQQADAYKARVIAEAEGAAARFLSIYTEYRRAPDVTRRRIFLETMERVLGGMNKVIIDDNGKGSGVVPYLPLPELERRRPAPQAGGGS
jgi:membrane protease subunit HflK